MSDPKIVVSPLSRKFEEGGISVTVEIYQLEGSDGWMLELVDNEGNSTVWVDPFPTDQAALDEFVQNVNDHGLAKMLEADDEDPLMVH